MTEQWLVATLHLLGLGIGLAAIFARARSLRRPLDADGLRRLYSADTWWGIAAALWIVTGLLRAFTPLEKGALYYMQNPLFHAKFGLVGLILLLEIWPMIAFLGWRVKSRRGETPDTSRARLFAILSDTQTLLVLVILGLATAIARGMGGMIG